jgi:methionyl-tRNA formyltransferase
MRIAFAGTPEFARASLSALHDAGHEVALVLTQPDRPAGRGMKLQASPVKAWAQAHGMAIAQPRSLRLDGRYPEDARAARAQLLAIEPQLMVVAAYGLILPRWVLELPRLGCLNVHGSLLPRWRGAAPIQRAIEAGDAFTGITIMQMDEGLDTGPMLLARSEPIRPDDTSATLHDRLAALGASLIVEALRQADAGSLVKTPQPTAGVTYAKKVDKAEAAIDWHQPAAEIERRIRAFDPFPGASIDLPAGLLKVWRARVVDSTGPAGTVLQADSGAPRIACGQAALELIEVQPAGGRRMPAPAWALSHPLPIGSSLAA